MVRIGAGRIAGSSGSGSDDRDNQQDEKRDKNTDNNTDGTTRAASGFIRAGLNQTAGSQEIESEKHSAVGTNVDSVVTGDGQPNITASDSSSLNQTVTTVVSEDVTGGDGGTGASINTQTGEIDAGRPGDTSRLAEAVNRATGGSGGDGGNGGGGGGSSGGSSGGGGGGGGGGSGGQDVVTVLRRAASPTSQAGGQPGMMPMMMPGGGSGSSSGGGIMDTLTSPIGLVLAGVVALAVGFGGSQVVDDG